MSTVQIPFMSPSSLSFQHLAPLNALRKVLRVLFIILHQSERLWFSKYLCGTDYDSRVLEYFRRSSLTE